MTLNYFNDGGISEMKFPDISWYLSERKQRTKINLSFSYWADILFGVRQGSILGPVLSNAHICDHFFEVRDLEYASFVDDATPYSCLPEMIPILE